MNDYDEAVNVILYYFHLFVFIYKELTHQFVDPMVLAFAIFHQENSWVTCIQVVLMYPRCIKKYISAITVDANVHMFDFILARSCLYPSSISPNIFWLLLV
jgi:hypothetical protein